MFPSFKEVPEQELCSDDESIKANEEANNLNLGDENDSEVVSDDIFCKEIQSPYHPIGLSSRVMEDTVPADVYSSPVGSKPIHGSHKGGSLLEVLDGNDLISSGVSRCILLPIELTKQMQDIKSTAVRDQMQKAKIQWAVEGDENSKFLSMVQDTVVSRVAELGMASVLVNGSPTSEFQFHCGLKQGDPLAPYLFILVMESLHLSVSRTVEAGIFTDNAWDDMVGNIKSSFRSGRLLPLHKEDVFTVTKGGFRYANSLLGKIIVRGGWNSAAQKHQDLDRSKISDLVDEVLLPKENVATDGIKTIPIKICNVLQEDTSHLSFPVTGFSYSQAYMSMVGTYLSPVDSYCGWLEWFKSIRWLQA
ncbi:hypothetical protein Tco_0893802 [Tanacetum coccineum]|uniref:Reverse transcriptase domain-containing protein n=1 Tax=Tanacetum coccineum TaxID=301880 RepID=A0ABQ5CA14_9ASTR